MGKARKKHAGKEILFDETARREFITGFRKRKRERQQHARQKIAQEVRREKLEERQERREHLREIRGYAQAGGSDEDSDGSDEPENAERSSYIIGDTLTTTVVSSLLNEPVEQRAADSSSGANTATARAGRPSQPQQQQIKAKKFNLNVPLATAIPGYKPPSGLKKARKKPKKKKIISKKEKARNRACVASGRSCKTIDRGVRLRTRFRGCYQQWLPLTPLAGRVPHAQAQARWMRDCLSRHANSVLDASTTAVLAQCPLRAFCTTGVAIVLRRLGTIVELGTFQLIGLSHASNSELK